MKVEVVAFVMSTRRGVDRLAQMAPKLSVRDSVRDLEVRSQAAPDHIASGMDSGKGQDVFLTRIKFTYVSLDETTDDRLSTWILRWVTTVMQGLRIYDSQVVVKR